MAAFAEVEIDQVGLKSELAVATGNLLSVIVGLTDYPSDLGPVTTAPWRPSEVPEINRRTEAD